MYFATDVISLNLGMSRDSIIHFNRNGSFGSSKNETCYKNVFCDYCKNTCNIKDKCYKLHDFLANYKFNKEKRIDALVQEIA